MAESMTYSSLITDVSRYAERDDASFVDYIPRLIMLAENRIASEIHGLGYVKAAIFNFLDGNPILEKPARWRETRSMSVKVNNEISYLKYRSYPYCRSYWPNQALTETPLFYADYDYEHYLIAPTPSDDFEGELLYHERPQPLDETNQANWTTQYAPQLILYATLLEAQPWLKLDARIQVFQSMYDRASQMVTQEAQRRAAGDDTLTRREG